MTTNISTDPLASNHGASSFRRLAPHDYVAACLPGFGEPVFVQYFANFAR